MRRRSITRARAQQTRTDAMRAKDAALIQHKLTGGPDIDDFDELVGALKPGRVLPRIVRYRQGGDARSWAQPGLGAYAPKGAFMQMGSAKWTGSSATSGSTVFDFPVAFAETPIVICAVVNTAPYPTQVVCQASSDGPGMEVYWWAASGVTEIWFHWIAIGPGGI